MRAQPRVLVVDDEPLVAEGLAFRLAGDERLSIVGAAASPCQAIEQVATLQPDVTLLEIRLKGSDGIALIETLAQRSPGMAVLVLSRHGDPELVRDALGAGARGYLLKTARGCEVIAAIEAVAAGSFCLSARLASELFARAGPQQVLSKCEQQVMACIAQGKASKQIARELGVSPRTIESHRCNIKQRLGIEGRAHLIKYAVENCQ